MNSNILNKKIIPLAAMLTLAFACGSNNNDNDNNTTAILAALTSGSSSSEINPALSYDEFKAMVYKEPWEGGVYIFNGDETASSEKKLKEFYEQNFANNGIIDPELIVHQSGGSDAAWSADRKKNLTYCVSTGFGSQHQAVKEDMTAAAGAWADAANVRFVHDSTQDDNCTASNNNVLFDVRPVNVNGQYLARAFFPGESRRARNVLIDQSALNRPNSRPTLTGILRHELGHTLGFRHEHTRPESGTCFEDTNWRALTPYDSDSVMHYPQCNGTGDWSLSLTSNDIKGAVALYGLPGNVPPTPNGEDVSESFSGSAARSQMIQYGPFDVVPGSVFKAVLSGSGDGDLYVRFGAEPTTRAFNCRPYLNGSNETCSLDVPADTDSVYVMVRGYTAATFGLKVDYNKPTSSQKPVSLDLQGSLARGAYKAYGPYNVVPGTEVAVALSPLNGNTGDADLYVRFGSAPTGNAFDCRPYKNGSVENCTLTVPANETELYVTVDGYTAVSYGLNISYITE